MDKATTFLKSVSKFATNPAINIVVKPTTKMTGSKGLGIMGWNRIIKKTPAVTKVEEWTKAETGVGAAMAAGSQAEKGICALLVIALKIINKAINGDTLFIKVKL